MKKIYYSTRGKNLATTYYVPNFVYLDSLFCCRRQANANRHSANKKPGDVIHVFQGGSL